MFFWNSLAFSIIQQMLTIWSLVPLLFLKPAWTSGSSHFMYCWSLAWGILSITLLACEMSAIVWLFEHSLALAFFGIGMKMDLFQSCGHCWVFQICWHIECSTFTASSFRICNSSTGITSPPLALFIVMLSKTHFTSHSRMSGSKWVITPSWSSFLSEHLFIVFQILSKLSFIYIIASELVGVFYNLPNTARFLLIFLVLSPILILNILRLCYPALKSS